MDYDWVFEKGYADFDSQSECEDFIRWAIDEIKKLREDNVNLLDVVHDFEACKMNCLY